MTSSGSCLPDLTLAVNTAEEVLQLVLGEPGDSGPRLLAAREWEAAGRFAEVLMPGLADLLKGQGLSPAHITRIACVRGPGSFTGLRIGLASVAGLAAGLDIPTTGLDHLTLLAKQAAPNLNGTLGVAVHGRTRQVAFQAFSCPDAAPLGPVQSLRLEQVAEAVHELPGPVRLLGTGLKRNPDFFADLAESLGQKEPALLGPESERYTPETLLEAAFEAEYSLEPVEPAYLRPSDAEENLEAIAKARGLDPDQAREMLDKAREGS